MINNTRDFNTGDFNTGDFNTGDSPPYHIREKEGFRLLFTL
jgi:hypothetical protein